MIYSRAILLAAFCLLACHFVEAAPANKTESKDAKGDSIPASAKLRSRRNTYNGQTNQDPGDDDSDAAIAAIPFDDGDKLTDKDDKHTGSNSTTASKHRREINNEDYDVNTQSSISQTSENDDESQNSSSDSSANGEVEVVFVPIYIREKQIIFIEEEPQQQTTAAYEDSDYDTTTSDYDDSTDTTTLAPSTNQVDTTTTESNLVDPEDVWNPDTKVSEPSTKVNVLPKDNEIVDRKKRETSSDSDDSKENSTDTGFVDVVVSIFEFGPVLNATDNSTKADGQHERKARSPDSSSTSGGAKQQTRGSAPVPPPRPLQKSTPKPSRPVVYTRPNPPTARPAPISPSRGKRSNNYGAPPCCGNSPYGGGLNQRGNRGSGGSSSATADANASSSGGGRGGSSASASASASSASRG